MEKKISSYQKLKDEIEERNNQIHELKTDILHIIRYPDSPADIQARTKHEISFKMDDAIWFSERTHFNKAQFQGLLDIASKNPEGEYVIKDFNPYPEPICSDKFRSHDLKTIDPYFSEIVSGNKTFEVRIKDRDFRAGDLLILKQYDNKLNCYTGNHCFVNVTFILQGGSFGIHKDYVVMSIKKTEI